MKSAQYEPLEESVGFYGEIPGVAGVWATGRTQEACAKELLEVLEEWVNIGVARGYELPICEEE